MRNYTREQWLGLTPETYLAGGYLDDKGDPRTDFLGDYVTAATMRLMAEDASAQELAFVFEALQMLLPSYQGTPRRRLVDAMTEAYEVVARAIQRQVDAALVRWLNCCVAAVTTEAELSVFLGHVQAVVRRYSVIAELMPDGAETSSMH
jgi:hypothetical protein